MSTAPSPMIDAALSYARTGWRVLPLHNLVAGTCSCGRATCRPGGKDEKSIAKHPRTGNWQVDATTDEGQIVAWWRQWPQANIGVATGRASGILVLDVDVHRDKPGFASLEVLETFLGKLPRTRASITGSGGRHMLFRYPANFAVGNSAGWRGAAGIDWRGDGGQIVVAPSVALAGAYRWVDLADVAELPSAWIEAHREYEAQRGQKKKITTSKKLTAPNEAEIAEDDDIIDAMHSAANAEKFTALWTGEWEKASYESQSNADLALCSIISFWCDPDEPEPDADRIDRIFRRSELYRDKWERDDYRDNTVAMAVELERKRRANDAALREHILGSIPERHDDAVAAARAKLRSEIGSIAPAPPPAPSIRTADVLAKIRQVVNKKKKSTSPKAKLDGDLTENFMAGEALVSSAELVRTPSLIIFTGDSGLKRVAWLLGNNLPSNISWDAILNSRPQFMRVVQNDGDLAMMGKAFQEAQIARLTWDAKKVADQETRRARIHDYYLTRKVR